MPGGKFWFLPVWEKDESRIDLPTRRPQLVQPVVDALRHEGYLLLSVAPARQSLEELFMEAIRTGGRLSFS